MWIDQATMYDQLKSALWYAFSYGLVLLLVPVLVLYLYYKYALGYWKRRDVEFLEPSIPFGNIGAAFDGKTHLINVYKDFYNQIKGPFAGFYRFASPAIMLKDPELIKQILVKDFNSFHDRGVSTDTKTDPLSGHLFRLEGLKWKHMRTKLSPTFTSGKLKMMFPILIQQGKQFQESLDEYAETGQLIEARNICAKFTIDVINSVTFGIQTNSFKDPNNDMRRFTQAFISNNCSYFQGIINTLSFAFPPVVQFFRLKIFNKRLNEFLFSILRKIIDYRETNKVTRNDFLQLLIQLKNKGEVSQEDDASDKSIYEGKTAADALTFEEISAQAFVFLFAGFDTSATTMSFALYEISRKPEIQRKIQEEIDRVLEKHGGIFSYDSVAEMTYLGSVISETLRLWPPLAFLSRIANKDYRIPDSNVVLEKGTIAYISLTGLHYDPNNFPDPENFNPDRFSPENKDSIKDYTYMPFGEGPRLCIGMRMGKMQSRVGLAMILQKFNFSITSETPKKLTPKYGPILISPQEEITLKVTRRA